jgi:hypothetical protein
LDDTDTPDSSRDPTPQDTTPRDTKPRDAKPRDTKPPAASASESPAAAGASTPAEPFSLADAPELSADDLKQVDGMKRRDREVRSHEQAYQAAGGADAGSMRLTYQMGPDGKRYAVEGSVPLDVSPVAGDPAATLRKMEVVTRAARAPASPSGADRAVAAQAALVAERARAQLAAERYAQARDTLFPPE